MPEARLLRGAFARLGLVAALGVCALAGSFASRADEAGACRLTYAAAHQIGAAVHDDEPDVAFHDYGGADATALVKAFNAIPPVSEWQADHVLVIERDDDVRVALAKDGCAFVAFRVPKLAWEEVRRAALGDPS